MNLPELAYDKQHIQNFDSLIDYLGTIRLIEFSCLFKGIPLTIRSPVSRYRHNQGIVLAMDARTYMQVVRDAENTQDCIVLPWLEQSAITYLPGGFRMRHLTCRYLKQDGSEMSYLHTLTEGRDALVKVTPEKVPVNEPTLIAHLEQSPYVIVSGDDEGNHYPVQVVRLTVSPRELRLTYDDWQLISITKRSPLQFRPDGFSMGNLNFDYTVDPEWNKEVWYQTEEQHLRWARWVQGNLSKKSEIVSLLEYARKP